MPEIKEPEPIPILVSLPEKIENHLSSGVSIYYFIGGQKWVSMVLSHTGDVINLRVLAPAPIQGGRFINNVPKDSGVNGYWKFIPVGD